MVLISSRVLTGTDAEQLVPVVCIITLPVPPDTANLLQAKQGSPEGCQKSRESLGFVTELKEGPKKVGGGGGRGAGITRKKKFHKEAGSEGKGKLTELEDE